MTPNELKQKISAGLLSFPVTHFDHALEFNKSAYQDHITWLASYDAAALFAAGGTGELFSLTPSEVAEVVSAAKEVAGELPIISGCGYGTKMAVAIAKEVEQKGADGILLLPHYLTGAPQAGLYGHIKAVCDAVDCGVIIYNRANSVAHPETIEKLCDSCPNLIGFKDGSGNIDLVRQVVARCGSRLAYIGGMPTHEIYAEAYDAMGVTTYSSAVFNFVPEMARDFYRAMRNRDRTTMNRYLLEFFYPFLAIRERAPGYAVSIIKAGLKVIGRDPGSVRPPLTDLSQDEQAMLSQIVKGFNR